MSDVTSNQPGLLEGSLWRIRDEHAASDEVEMELLSPHGRVIRSVTLRRNIAIAMLEGAADWLRGSK